MRRFALICALLLLLTSCTNAGSGDIIDEVSDIVSDMTEEGAEGYTLQLGIAQEHNASESKVKFAATFASVICDGEGRIVSCAFDAIDHSVSVMGGAVDAGGEYPSKRELGDDYKMKNASPIGREWYQQADHFAEYIKGYTIDEVLAVEGGEADLVAGCTIDIDPFKAAIGASDDGDMKRKFSVKGDPKASLAVVSSDEGAKNASETSDGIAALSSTYAAVALEGKRIAAAVTEATETKVYFDMAGLVSNISKGPGKRAQGDSYGMKSASPIEKEWYQQASALEEYLVTMNSDQVAAVSMNDGRAADDDLRAGCTIVISDLVSAISRAAEGIG